MKYLLFLSLVTTAIYCQTAPSNGRSFSNIATSAAFKAGKRTGTLQGDFVKELSGIAPSRRNPGAYWVHNDGKKVKEIYLIDSLGKRLATCKLPLTETEDCEDIEVGIDPKTGISYIYLADTGDNNKVFATHYVYRIPEPVLPPGAPQPAELNAKELEKWAFQYPEGQQYNAETLLFDPKTQDLFILSKDPGNAILFKFPFPQSASATTTLTRLGNFPIDKATGGDVSPNGGEVLIKNKQEIFYWTVGPGESLADALQNHDPQRVPYQPETQGEAICFNLGATGFLTSTERDKSFEQAVFFYARQ